MSDFHPEWLADLGPWHTVGDTPFLARCLPSDPDAAILILRPWGPWEEQRWRAVFSPPDRDDDGQDWRHGEIKAPGGRYWPDRESAEAALDAAWSAWRERYRASRGIAPDHRRRHNLLVTLTPSLLARIEALGFKVGSEGVLPWLVGKAEEMRAECDAFATYRETTTTALGIEPSSCAEDVAEAVNEMRAELNRWHAVSTSILRTAAKLRGGSTMANGDLADVVVQALQDAPKLAQVRAAANLRHEIDVLRRERHAERQRVQERDEEIAEMRLTLAAEQGRAEGAPSEGWGEGAGEVRWGKVAGGDEDAYGIGMLVEQVWSAFILRGWRWTCHQLHDRGSTLIVEGIAPTARAAMLAADKALETP